MALTLPLLALLLGCRTCGEKGAPSIGPSQIAVPPAAPTAAASAPAAAGSALPPMGPRPGRPETLAEMMGVNEGVSLPQALIRKGQIQPQQEPELLLADATAMQGLGARVVRANTATYPWIHFQAFQQGGGSFERVDRWVKTVTEAGLTPLMMLGPWPGIHTASHTDSYLPKDMPAYLAYVRAVVERYDGDGVDDMPGLTAPVRTWEVDNEPDLHNTVAPKGGGGAGPPELFQTQEEYAVVLVATAATIREADPQALILSAGFYRPHTPQGKQWIAGLLEQPGVREAIDILSLHCYYHQDALDTPDRTIQAWRELLPDKGLWVTETSVPISGKQPYVSETWQGKMVAATFGAMLAGGADRVFWHTLADPPASTPSSYRSPFATNSLFQAMGAHDAPGTGGLREKPAATVYRHLNRLAGPSRSDSFVELEISGGRVLQTDRGWLVFWGEVSPPAGATHSVDLLTGTERPVAGRVSAPAWLEARPSDPG